MAEPVAATSAIRGATLDRFQIQRAVAPSGDIGVVLDALMDPGTRRARRVALTVLDPARADVAGALEAWSTATRSPHPALLAPIEFGVDGEVPFVATPWLDGVTLSGIAQAIRETRSPRIERWLASIGAEVADALGSLGEWVNPHGPSEPLVHGRLGPHRILVLRTGQVRILGFPTRASAAASDGVPEPFRAPSGWTGPAVDTYAVARMLQWMGDGRIAEEEPALAAILDEALAEPQSPRWLGARLGRYLSERGGPLSSAEWRVVLAEMPTDDSSVERAQAETLARRLLRRTPAAAPPAPEWFAWAVAGVAALLVGGAVELWVESPAPEPPRPTVATAPAPTERPEAAPPDPSPAPAPAAATPLDPRPERAPAPAAAPGPPRLIVDADPDGVVYVDDRPLGTTPLDTTEVPAGSHRVEVRLGGHATASRSVELRDGRPVELSFRLDREQPQDERGGTGLVTLRSTPPSVVYVDGAPLGTTPIVDAPLPADLHVVEFKLGGHATERREVRVSRGGHAVIDATLSVSR